MIMLEHFIPWTQYTILFTMCNVSGREKYPTPLSVGFLNSKLSLLEYVATLKHDGPSKKAKDPRPQAKAAKRKLIPPTVDVAAIARAAAGLAAATLPGAAKPARAILPADAVPDADDSGYESAGPGTQAPGWLSKRLHLDESATHP